MVTIPRNSLNGEAKLFLFPILLERFSRRLMELLNFSINEFSALYPFTTLSPPRVSSKIEMKIPFSFCAFTDLAFRFLPIREMIIPETGINPKTKKVSVGLMINIVTIEKIIVNGSRTTNSKI